MGSRRGFGGRLTVRAALSGGLAIFATPLMAQAVPPATPPAASDTGQPVGTDSADIVVTAQKRAERSIDVPISITTVSGDSLARSGVRNARDLVQVVPSLHIDQDGSYTQPTLRGVGNAVAGPGSNPAVATYIDGFYQPSLLAGNYDLVGISSIEVLKGPQGTLFGRNSTGGAIVIATRNPSLDRAQLDLTLAGGRFNDFRTTAYISIPVSSTLAVNLAGLFHRSDGFVRNDFTGNDAARQNKYTLRGKILWQPSERFSALLTLNKFRDRDDSSVAYASYPYAIPALPGNPAPVNNIAPLFAPGSYVETRRGHTYTNDPQEFLVRGESAGLALNLDVGDFAKLTSYTQYRKERAIEQIDYDASASTLYTARFPQNEKTFTQELNLASVGTTRFTWLAGLYYYYDNSSNGPYIEQGALLGGGPPDNRFFTRERAKSYAGFVDGTYEILDRLFLTAGVRYTHERQTDLSFIPGRFPLLGPATRTGAQKFHAFTPRAVLRYNIERNTNVFASFSKGYKSGGFSGSDDTSQPGDLTGSTIPAYKPEKITAYELGFKTKKGPYRIEGSVFHSDYTNQQVASYTDGVGHIKNAASSKITGAEIQVDASITRGLLIGVGGAYTHARYSSFPNSSAQSLSTSIPPFSSNPVIDVSGLQTQRAPTWTGNVTATYTRPIGNGDIAVNASYYRTSKFSFEPTHTYMQGGYGVLNGRVTYTLPGGHYSISAYGNNLTNSNYLSSVLPFSTAILTQYGRPREWGAELTVHF